MKNQKLFDQTEQVIEYLQTHKWVQGSLYGNASYEEMNTGKCCVYGAALSTVGMYSSFNKAFDEWLVAKGYALTVGEQTQEPRLIPMAYYNDHVAKDKRYVIRKLRQFQKEMC